MDLIYIVTGLCTLALAIAGLVLTCHLERRSLGSRRSRAEKRMPARERDGQPIVT